MSVGSLCQNALPFWTTLGYTLVRSLVCATYVARHSRIQNVSRFISVHTLARNHIPVILVASLLHRGPHLWFTNVTILVRDPTNVMCAVKPLCPERCSQLTTSVMVLVMFYNVFLEVRTLFNFGHSWSFGYFGNNGDCSCFYMLRVDLSKAHVFRGYWYV
jgi:hypothetical protein